ncbi:serine hydrolase domain-containing protein [Hymenobacter rigui]|uniref:Class A beta-lactamase-related serine hydrolase n=1 Tax=Hymenobacter rigui TaxID=334424 RepID=A0A428KM45_9BACT|nr:serine hydrolase domain-containing protein [Hymenobacter rigui]RSK47510.1 class A beta-lactamase-related serine hydrolase [Hymenobacter rigui]
MHLRFLLCPLLLVALLPARLRAQSPAIVPATVAARRAAVEQGLMPYVPVQGLPGWSLLERMRYYRVPGLSIAVIHNYRVEWAQGYGLADTTTQRPVTPATLFSAGSISKLVTAIAALQLVQEGRLALDAPINSYLTSWQLADNDWTRRRPVTLRQLLSHQGGTSQSAYFGFVPGRGPLPSVVDVLSGQPAAQTRPVVVNREPGTGFNYSGGGYMVAQLALMDVTHQDFATLTEQRLFRPLKLRSLTFRQPLPAAWQARAAGAYSENAWFKGMPYVYPQQAAAGLYATPTDLARLLIEVQQAYRGKGRVLQQATARTLLTPQADVSAGTYREQIALGPFLLQRADQQGEASRYFEHTGVNAGFVAYAIGSVVGGEGVVIMMNQDGGASELGKEVRRAVARVYGWPAFLPPALVPRPAAPGWLAAVAGRYQRGPDEVLDFRVEGEHLVERINGGPGILCYPGGGDTLAFTDFPLRAVFERAPDGRVAGLRMLAGGPALPRLPNDALLPNELLRLERVAEAVAGYRNLQLGEYPLTYLIYELLNPRRPGGPDVAGARGLLELARQQYPQSGIVAARWGDWYALTGDKSQAALEYRRALQDNPSDQDLLDKLAAVMQ